MNTDNKATLISILIWMLPLYKVDAQIFIEIQKDSIVNFYERSGYTQIDSNIQHLHQDSINIMKSKIKGLWHYQGKLEGDKLVPDTLYWSDEGTFFVKKGIIYQLKNGIETKTDEIDVSSFENEGIIGFHTRANGNAYEIRLHRPIFDIVYHANSIGIYSGRSFLPIKYLDNKILIIEVEVEYDFKYISNEYSTIRIKKEYEYFVRKE